MLASFFLSTLIPAVASPGQVPKNHQSLTVIRGALGAIPGKGPFLNSGGKQILLSGQSAYILKTLEDKRLLNQELQLTGTFAPDGSLSVQKLYAVRGGKLYRIQYYCEVCNITYVQPGHCYCCGRETKLQEVPVQTGAH
ncbi:MAG TPA: hypothetical protein VKV79_02705 [Terriglobia bacterium]|nr:hypothetical protein [Terriglobia bacterium]